MRGVLLTMEETNERDERDPFTRFMFGDSRRRTTNDFKEENEGDKRENDSFESKRSVDPFGFGRRPHAEKESKNDFGTIGTLLQNLDYNELMNQIDTIMTSANELKPLLKELKPLVESFIQKK